MDGWMEGRMNGGKERVDGGVHGWMDPRKNGRMVGWKECRDPGIDGWMDEGSINGQMDE